MYVRFKIFFEASKEATSLRAKFYAGNGHFGGKNKIERVKNVLMGVQGPGAVIMDDLVRQRHLPDVQKTYVYTRDQILDTFDGFLL